MRPHGTQDRLALLRNMGVERLLEGQSVEEIASVLGVSVRTVFRWQAQYQAAGWRGLEPGPVPGRPPKLTDRQSRQVLSWLSHDPREFGFDGARWTARRLAAAIQDRLHVRFNHRYLCAWLETRGISPQRPELIAREKDQAMIDRWLAKDWPRIKKTRRLGALRSDLPMNRAF